MKHYNEETSVVTMDPPAAGMQRLVPARDAFYTEVDATRNAAEAASRTLRRSGVGMATLIAIEDFYMRLYLRRPGQHHPTAADFQEFVDMVMSTPESQAAWATFSQAFALAVPLQHCVNAVMMTQDKVVDCDRTRLVASLGMALAAMPDRGLALKVREAASEGMVVAEPPAAEFLMAAQTGVVKAALEFAVEQLARQQAAMGGRRNADELGKDSQA